VSWLKKRNPPSPQKKQPSVTQENKKKKSIGFVSGLAFGTAVAAGAAFLYKTKKGKQFRKQLAGHYDDAHGYLGHLIKDIKKQAKKLELDLEKSNQVVDKKTKVVKKKVKSQTQIAKVKSQTQIASTTARRVFKRLGKPLVK